ncbi:Autophagy protein Apg17 [Rhizoctonia solani]|uniref:Autophagy-related protein 17 n=1 Tax=Rhizoctonia solani TaxID=456999 RepID=A0A8H7M1Z1_9AGAM|nr:Autophagy protein Apg17 [Rhizoctonia solani]
MPTIAPHPVATEPASPAPTGSSLAALFLTSKKALLHGNNVCNHASTLTAGSSNLTVDILTLDAKLQWLTRNVADQLKAANSVAKYLESERDRAHSAAKEWDRARSRRTRSLDAILEQLGNQAVPPSLHKTVAGSSIFGSPRSDTGRQLPDTPQTEINDKASLGASGLNQESDQTVQERSRWKTLRDFIDERSIEEALERIEDERLRLDDSLARSYDFPQALDEQISAVRNALPRLSAQPILHEVHRHMTEQDRLVHAMAEDLEGIARHFGQVKDALQVEDDGGVINMDDIRTLDQDTNELSAVVRDLDQSGGLLRICSKNVARCTGTSDPPDDLTKLKDLEEMMMAMLAEQDAVHHEANSLLETLNSRLVELENLEAAYLAYRRSYARLLQEMARRERYRRKWRKWFMEW